MVAVIDARGDAFQRLDGGGKATLELIIVIGIKEIVLAIVLIMEDCVGVAKSLRKQCPLIASLGAAAIGETAPRKERLREIARDCQRPWSISACIPAP